MTGFVPDFVILRLPLETPTEHERMSEVGRWEWDPYFCDWVMITSRRTTELQMVPTSKAQKR